jgi:hypothetical protein
MMRLSQECCNSKPKNAYSTRGKERPGRRAQEGLPPVLVGMETCATALQSSLTKPTCNCCSPEQSSQRRKFTGWWQEQGPEFKPQYCRGGGGGACWALVGHACNPSHLGGKDQEDQGSRPAWANSSRDPFSKIPNTKQGWWSGSSGSSTC